MAEKDLLIDTSGNVLEISNSRTAVRIPAGAWNAPQGAEAGAVAQHGLHVFGVYPWVGLLRAGRQGPALEVIDRCRIRWGRVVSIDQDLVRVASRPLGFDGSLLALEEEREEEVRRSVDGVGFVDELHVGDLVSLHWDWVCDRLTPRELRWLTYCTDRNLRAVNSLSRPGPAEVCGV